MYRVVWPLPQSSFRTLRISCFILHKLNITCLGIPFTNNFGSSHILEIVCKWTLFSSSLETFVSCTPVNRKPFLWSAYLLLRDVCAENQSLRYNVKMGHFYHSPKLLFNHCLLLLLGPGNHQSTFCLCRFAFSGHFISMEKYHMWCFISFT